MQQTHAEGNVGNVLGFQGQTEEVTYAGQSVEVSPLQKLKAALDLAETMPPSKIRKNMVGLITLAPQIEENLMQKIDLPLQIDESDPNQPFLKTQFNRDGDSYRSCITNKYYPPSQGYIPSEQYRSIQQLGYLMLSEYTKLYYGSSAVGSFFISEGNDANHFSCGYFAKKQCNDGEETFGGSWDSFNIADIELQGDEATIKLNTTILIEMNSQQQKRGIVDLTGFLKKKKVQKRKLGKERLQSVIVAFGQMVEDLQTNMRQHLQSIYVSKTQQIIFTTRFQNTVAQVVHRKTLAQNLKEIHLQG